MDILPTDLPAFGAMIVPLDAYKKDMDLLYELTQLIAQAAQDKYYYSDNPHIGRLGNIIEERNELRKTVTRLKNKKPKTKKVTENA